MTAPVPAFAPLRPGQAAYILGVSPPMVRQYANRGLLTRDERGRYDAAEVRALQVARDTAREQRRVRREQRARDRAALRRAARVT